MKSAGLLKREHFTTQHVLKLCKSWPRDILETKIINGFKSWWGDLAEDGDISFCSKLCPGWNPRSSCVTRSCERGEVTQCLLYSLCPSPECSFLTTLGAWSQLRLCSLVWQLLLCCYNWYAFKIYDWHLFLFFLIFHRCLKWEAKMDQCVCPLQLFQMAEKEPTPHSQRDCWPRKSLLGWERSWGTDSHLPPPHTVCCPRERAMQTLPCQHFPHQPWATSSS